MSKSKEWTPEQVGDWAGAHVLVYAGDGTGRPGPLMFESHNADESKQICAAILAALAARSANVLERAASKLQNL